MSWSLDFHLPREPELLEAFLLALGKALYLACGFEAKCRWVLQMAIIADHYKVSLIPLIEGVTPVS